MTTLAEVRKWPEPIVRDGPYKIYKGHKYTVYDDGNSAETPYQTDLAEAALVRLRYLIGQIRWAYEGMSMPEEIGEALADVGDVPA